MEEAEDCPGDGDDDLARETEEHLLMGQQQCQEALVSQGLKTAMLTSQLN